MENRNRDEGILADKEKKCTAFPGVHAKYES